MPNLIAMCVTACWVSASAHSFFFTSWKFDRIQEVGRSVLTRMRSSLSVVLPPHSQGDLRPAKLPSSFFTGFPTLICITQPRGCLGMTSHESVTPEIYRLPSVPNNTFHNNFFTQAPPFCDNPPSSTVHEHTGQLRKELLLGMGLLIGDFTLCSDLPWGTWYAPTRGPFQYLWESFHMDNWCVIWTPKLLLDRQGPLSSTRHYHFTP